MKTLKQKVQYLCLRVQILSWEMLVIFFVIPFYDK